MPQSSPVGFSIINYNRPLVTNPTAVNFQYMHELDTSSIVSFTHDLEPGSG